MNNDATAVDRWNDDGGASYKPDLPVGRGHPLRQVQLNLVDKPKIAPKTPGEWRSGRFRTDSRHVLPRLPEYLSNRHGKIISARELFRLKYHR
jgi:hypothetical protein